MVLSPQAIVSSTFPTKYAPAHNAGNLPLALASFIGRKREIAELKRLLTRSRLVTLTGPGGCGKTRLALELASKLPAKQIDAIWLIELASVADGALVPWLVASTLDVRELAGRAIHDTLIAVLRAKNVLLILDNCEHVIGACAQLAETLVQNCPRLKILATSREALGILGEQVWHVAPLAVPDLSRRDFSVRELSRYEAIRLFAERATAARRSFKLSSQNANAVMNICRRLDGMALAIELAAARVKAMSPEQIDARLNDRFRLLNIGSRTAPPRHQTLQAAIDWSYDLLSDAERTLFRRLAIFAGGWTLDAAEEIAPASNLLDTLAHLVDKSLVKTHERNRETRYSMLDTLQQYALARLAESNEQNETRTRHLDYYARLASVARANSVGPLAREWLGRIESELDNFRAAMLWAYDSQPIEPGLSIAINLCPFWIRRGHFAEGLQWLEKFLAAIENRMTPLYAKGLKEAAALAIEAGDHTRADELANAALNIAREMHDDGLLGSILKHVGLLAHYRGERAQAIGYLEQSLALLRRANDEWGATLALLWLADARMRQGELNAAKLLWDQALAQSRGLGETWGIAWALGGLGDVARLEGDFVLAKKLLREDLMLHHEIGNKSQIPFPLEALANLHATLQQPRRAARLWGAAEAARLADNEPLPPSYQNDYAPYIEMARAQIGAEEFAKEWASGRALALEQAIVYALSETEPSPRRARSTQSIILTARELDVLRLIAAGASNKEIAAKLFLSAGTVKWHTIQIYGKLAVRNRTQAVARARELNLL